ncbi:MAG: Dcm methylase [Gammaproteobacteria bacterium]|nr:Dcm methylase [Gammaproteobacteria bacterium]
MIAIFLYDYTGIMAKPWLDAGYDCYIVDIQHPIGTHQDKKVKNLYRVGADLRYGWLPPFNQDDIAFIAAFPDCTNTAVSGALHFQKKGARALSLSLDLFATAKEIGEWSKAPYMIENPVSTFSTYCGKPDYIFNPFEYGGYLPEDDSHPLWPDYIAARDAYPKKTCLWTGGGFAMPDKREVTPEEGFSRQHKKLGGKSLKTKNIRSATPRGFAMAVFMANSRILKAA